MQKLSKFVLTTAFSLSVVLPLAASAQGFFYSSCGVFSGLSFLLCKISYLLNSVLPVLVALGVVYFVWGVVQYFIGSSEEAKKKGRDGIIFGIIGLVVIVSLWGLVYLVIDTFQGPYGGLDQRAPYGYEFNSLLPQ